MATSPEALIEELEATLTVEPPPRYNIAPTDPAPIVVTSREGERRLGLARFGLVPHWADDVKIGARLLNARAETAATKPAFRDAFVRHRCLVVADGFYEWRTAGKQKLPSRFVVPGAGPFAMAGLWAVWRDPSGERVSSFAILTCEAVGAVAAIHDRMPVVLPRPLYGAWLDRETTDPDAIAALLAAHRGAELEGYEVSTRVNSVKNDEPSLIEPVQDR